ncbi:MAG: flagellar biosynthesis repressor FlbT [Pseudomonadota bacterium]
MPLKLSLKPGETFILNGAVVRNGERRGVLLLENRARILREKDIMMPEQAETPVTRAYFAVMQMYLSGETDGCWYDHAALALADLIASQPPGQTRDDVLAISADIACGDLYKALGGCRSLIRMLEPAAFKEAV